MTSVFISSTSKDLHEYRLAAIAVCNQLKFIPVAMELFPAIPRNATSGSLEKVDEADLFVLILAHRYGHIEENQSKSVTHQEYLYAHDKRRLDCLCFLIDPDYAWPPSMVQCEKWKELKSFKNEIDQGLIRATFTSVDDFSHQLFHALVDWRDRHAGGFHADTLSARIITSSINVPELPSEFIGRGQLIDHINKMLDQKERVLLHGVGGIGKTALAATIASHRVYEEKGPALWLRVGDYGSDDLFQALAKPFNRQMEIVKQRDAARQNTMNELLDKQGINLLILDDVSPDRGKELEEVLDSVPQSIPVLITSQYKHSFVRRILTVDKLDVEESLELLSHYATRDLSKDAQARTLCKEFDGHPFALRLAGRAIDVDNLSPTDYLNRIKDSLHRETPINEMWLGNAISYSWIEPNLRSLDDTTREVFSHFGAFFAPGATEELLLRYRKQIKEGDTNEYRILIRKALNELQRRDLVQKRWVDDVADETFRYYTMHNLVYSYAQYLNQQESEEQHFKALEACLTYTRRFNTDSPQARKALLIELDNFLGAAKWAIKVGRYTDVEEFVRNLYDGSQLLQKEGFYEQTTELLSLAVEATQRNRGVYLSNQGRMYRDLGRYAEALVAFESALQTYREIKSSEPETEERPIPDIDSRANEGVILGYLGLTYSDLGDNKQAIIYCEQALSIANNIAANYKRSDRRVSDIQRVGNLGLSHAYRNQGNYKEAEEHLNEAIKKVRDTGDKGRESRYNAYLGLIYAYMGNYSDAQDRCEEGLRISWKMEQDVSGKRRSECANRGYLGTFYLDLGKLDKAEDHIKEALKITREIVDKRGEGNRLGDLGQVYLCQGKIDEARKYHKDGLSIVHQIGAKRSEGYRLAGLIETYFAKEDFDDYFAICLSDLQTMFKVPDLYPRDQHYWGTTIAQALLYRTDSGHDLKGAQEVLEKIVKFEDDTRGHFTHALYGVVLAKQEQYDGSKQQFEIALVKSEDLLKKTKDFYSAKYTKGLAYAGLAVLVENEAHEYIRNARDAYREAKQNCDAKGVIQSARRILKELPDKDNRLSEIYNLL